MEFLERHQFDKTPYRSEGDPNRRGMMRHFGKWKDGIVEVRTPYNERVLSWLLQAKAVTVWKVCGLVAERDDGVNSCGDEPGKFDQGPVLAALRSFLRLSPIK